MNKFVGDPGTSTVSIDQFDNLFSGNKNNERERETIYTCANNGKRKLRQTQIRFERIKPSIVFDRNFLLTEKNRMFTLKISFT